MHANGHGTATALQTKEAQYQFELDMALRDGLSRFGIMSNQTWKDDPRRLLFLLSRYKFVAKMLDGRSHVLEVGCGDGFGSRVVRQAVGGLTAIDTDPQFIETARETMNEKWPVEFRVHDVLAEPVSGRFDAIYSLDVLEHIPADLERIFLDHMLAPLDAHGVCVVGMPSAQSQVHASPLSVQGHVNCKDGKEYKKVMERHFENVFLFSMNDEVVHTGYHPMAHYLMAVCAGRHR